MTSIGILCLRIKCCTASEIFLDNAMHGARFCAITAPDTFFVINNCQIVFNVNCTVLTCSFAFAATDTTV